MIRIRFTDLDAKKRALGRLAGRFPFKSWVTGEMLVPEAALGFLGLSIPLPEPSWGNMLSDYEEQVLRGQAYLIAFPAIALVTTALCINLVGDGIRDALDPRQR